METSFPSVPIREVPGKSLQDAPDSDRPVVLVVDDDPVITHTLATILDRSGLTPITAQNGVDAIEIAALIPPDVLVTDLLTEEMSGIDLALEVRRTAPKCEVILITGHGLEAENEEEERLPGYNLVTLPKPVFPAALLACIFKCLATGVAGVSPVEVTENQSPPPAVDAAR
jgi:DNA-binding NtrC family response regulator